MAVTVDQFWENLGKSRLLTPEQLAQRRNEFAGVKGANNLSSCSTLAEWLVAEEVLSRYQMSVLRAGRCGPFYFGDYKVIDRVDSGSLAGQFRAVHVDSGHSVLLHFLTGAKLKERKPWTEAVREFETLRGVRSPNLSRNFELVDLKTFRFAVVESLRGESLADKIAGGALSASEAARIVRFAAIGLSQLHGAGLVHGELRPENIWIEHNENVKLLLPPLARELGRQTPAAASNGNGNVGQAMADYMAPELAHPGTPNTPQGDIYALGCVLYQSLSGRTPFGDASPLEKIRRHAQEPIEPLSSQGIPAEMDEVIKYMMAKNTAVRYRQADQVAEALTSFVDADAQQPIPASTNGSLASLESMLQRRHEELAKEAESVWKDESVADLNISFAERKKRAAAAGGAAATATAPVPASSSSPSRSSEESESLLDRRRGRRKSNQWVTWGVGGGVALAAIVALIIAAPYLSQDTPETADVDKPNDTQPVDDGPTTIADPDLRPPSDQTADPPSAGGSTTGGTQQTGSQATDTTAESFVRETTAPDDGSMLWASPTTGPPIDLKYLPLGSQVLVSARPAEVLRSAEGQKVVDGLGPFGQYFLSELQSRTGYQPQEIEQVLIGMKAARSTGPYESAMVIRLASPTTEDQMLSRWGNPSAMVHKEKKYYTSGVQAYYIPEEGGGRTFAVASQPEILEVIDLGGNAPPLRRELGMMLPDTDVNRHFTIIFPPRYLFGDGKGIFTGPLDKVQDPLDAYLGDGVQAALFSAHLADHAFFEQRVIGTIDTPANELAEAYRQRLDEIPMAIEEYIVSLNPHPYGRLILRRFPDMIRILNRFTRSGDENRQAVLRAYLPVVAAHNLALGSELALSEQGVGGTVVTTTAKPPSEMTLQEKLDKKISLSFPRDTLEMSLKMLSEEIGEEIVILGNDLQLDGITKNQSFGLDLRDQPARKVLEQIMLLANPDKTADGPSSPAQKLLYVIKPKEEGGEDAIFVTTRTQAEKRGDPIPPAFELEEPGKKN